MAPTMVTRSAICVGSENVMSNWAGVVVDVSARCFNLSVSTVVLVKHDQDVKVAVDAIVATRNAPVQPYFDRIK